MLGGALTSGVGVLRSVGILVTRLVVAASGRPCLIKEALGITHLV